MQSGCVPANKKEFIMTRTIIVALGFAAAATAASAGDFFGALDSVTTEAGSSTVISAPAAADVAEPAGYVLVEDLPQNVQDAIARARGEDTDALDSYRFY
jgi:hypothetical protein